MGQNPALTRFTLPDEGGLIPGGRFEMAVDAVYRNIRPASRKPLEKNDQYLKKAFGPPKMVFFIYTYKWAITLLKHL